MAKRNIQRELLIRELAGEATELCFRADTAERRLTAVLCNVRDKTVRGDLESLIAGLSARTGSVRAAIEKLYPKPKQVK